MDALTGESFVDVMTVTKCYLFAEVGAMGGCGVWVMVRAFLGSF